MSRVNWLAAGFAAILTLGFPLPAQSDDDDWKDYQKRIEESRKESENRYQNWRSEQDKRSQSWLEAEGTVQDRVLELPDSGLKPGRYTLRLPFGLGFRVEVPDDPQTAKSPPAWGPRSYGDVSHRARQINEHLRDLHLDLQRAGHAELTAEAARLYEQGTGVANAAATRQPAAEVRAQFAEFDRLWHPFVHRLGRQPELGASVQRRATVVDQLEDGLHQILKISPAPPYDRPLVAALCSELQQTTNLLLKDLKLEPQRTPDLHAITLWAQRVKQHAADLNATVSQNAPFATIVEEYEEFDRAWHRLLQQARVSPEVDAHVRRIARQVRQVDVQLHKELYVNVPIAGDRMRFRNVAAGIAKSANDLADDLDAEIGRRKRELVDEARMFASTARDLNGVITGRQSPQTEQRAVKELLESWQPLNAKIQTLDGERFATGKAIAAQLSADIQELQTLSPVR